jgi:hypothetical protein
MLNGRRRAFVLAVSIAALASAALTMGMFPATAATSPAEASTAVVVQSIATSVSTGNSHSCALTDAGGVKCWGWNSVGNLGDGTTVERHRPVSVVSFGPAPCVVPGVVGKRFAKARVAIARAKCRVGVVAHVHSKRPKNVVLRQSPRAGTQSNAGSKVRLIVSRG